MSLTAHLRSSRSPIRAWFGERFSSTAAVAREGNSFIRGARQNCPVPGRSDSDPGLVGIGVDYVLRASLCAAGLENTKAKVAGARLDRLYNIEGRATGAVATAVARTARLRPASRDLSDTEWEELCVLCLLLARFEQAYRALGRSEAVREYLVVPLLDGPGNVDALIGLAVPDGAVRDLVTLGRVAVADHGALGSREPVHPNPEFALTAQLGGADADLIAGGTLFEWKATATRRVVERESLWQLVGYVLADTHDEYAIHSVAIAALRWRKTITWPVDELLALLAKDDPGELNALRADFRDTVEAFRRQRAGRTR